MKLGDKTIDPVCGMSLGGFTNFKKISRQGDLFYFCGDVCRNKFKKDPVKFQKKPLISLKNVHKVFQIGKMEIEVLRGVYLNIWQGDFVAIIGSSGSGKSTTLNMMGLLDKPSSGKIFLEGKDTSLLSDDQRAKLRSDTFGFVFQQYNLVPWLNAYENVSLPLLFSENRIIKEKIEKEFKKIGLKDRMLHRPFELSGGEQQRVALLRALANNPKIILGDEPTGNLDSTTGDIILEMLIKLNKEEKKTLVIVTHDSDIAERADQIITLKDGRAIRDHQIYKKIYTE